MNLIFTNLVFALTVETAPTPAGPWEHLITSKNPCAEIHTVTVNRTKPAAFFRFRPHDNGKAPTPAAPIVYNYGTSLRLSCEAVEVCPSKPITAYRWFRNGELIATTTEPAASVQKLPGLYQLELRTADGISWRSAESSF